MSVDPLSETAAILLWAVVAAGQRAPEARGAAPGPGGSAVGMGEGFERRQTGRL